MQNVENIIVIMQVIYKLEFDISSVHRVVNGKKLLKQNFLMQRILGVGTIILSTVGIVGLGHIRFKFTR